MIDSTHELVLALRKHGDGTGLSSGPSYLFICTGIYQVHELYRA